MPSFYIGMPISFPIVFDCHECDQIESAFFGIERLNGPVMFESESKRLCGVQYIEFDALPGRESLIELLPALEKYYGFALTGDFESCQYCTYFEGDRSDWHVDMGYEGTEARKLTLVIQLSADADYDGGDLEFLPGHTVSFARCRGTVIVFPAFLAHQVTEINSGHRKTLVTWLHGPKFR
jgi:PKHD-type hydroxylase